MTEHDLESRLRASFRAVVQATPEPPSLPVWPVEPNHPAHGPGRRRVAAIAFSCLVLVSGVLMIAFVNRSPQSLSSSMPRSSLWGAWRLSAAYSDEVQVSGDVPSVEWTFTESGSCDPGTVRDPEDCVGGPRLTAFDGCNTLMRSFRVDSVSSTAVWGDYGRMTLADCGGTLDAAMSRFRGAHEFEFDRIGDELTLTANGVVLVFSPALDVVQAPPLSLPPPSLARLTSTPPAPSASS